MSAPPPIADRLGRMVRYVRVSVTDRCDMRCVYCMPAGGLDFKRRAELLSYEEIGTSTIQSRADAWLCAGTLVFALPGSTGAVRTAMDRILVNQLDIRTRPCNFIELLPRIQRGRRDG